MLICDRSDSIYIIAVGRVKVFLHGEDGKEVVLNVHGPGEYFGELALDEGPRSASVATLDTSRFYITTKAAFRQFLSAHPDFAMKLINRLMRRVRSLTENVKNLALLLPRLGWMIASLLTDRRVPVSAKLVLAAMAFYLASPLDLIPDVIPFFGVLDDMLVAALVVDGILNHVDRGVLLKYWPGPPQSLEAVATWARRLARWVPNRVKDRVFGGRCRPA